MAVAAATDVAVMGNGTRSQQAYESEGRVEPTIFKLMAVRELDQGDASATFPTWGAAIDAAATTESQSALTAQTLGTVGSLALTPSGVRAAMGGSSESYNRVLPVNDLRERFKFELKNASARYFAYDSSVGIVTYHFGQVSNSSTIGTATVSGGITAAAALRATLKDASAHIVWWGDDNMITQLDADIRTNGASAYGNVAQTDEIHAILQQNGFENGKAGYIYTLGGSIHVFKDPKPGCLGTSGASSISCMFVPNLAGLNGVPLSTGAKPKVITSNLAPGFAAAYRPDPVMAAKYGAVGNVEAFEDDAGAYVLMDRAYVGVNQGVLDVWRMGAVGILAATSCRKVLFTTT